MQNEWQSIDSAPRDRRRVLVYNAAVGIYTSQRTDGEYPIYYMSDTKMIGCWFPLPTHWQPLPKPPEGE